MVVDTKDSQAKLILQKSSIRTMRKDLALLREQDSLQEKRKISSIEAAPQKVAEIESPDLAGLESEIPTPQNQPSPIFAMPEQSVKPADDNEAKLAKVLERNIEPQNAFDEAKIKELASETEKQQIFLLKSQKSNLEKQIKVGGFGLENPQKAKLLIEKEKLQKKLAEIIEEGKNYADGKPSGGKETIGDLLADDGTIKEDPVQTTEKKRWVVEGELVKVNTAIKALDAKTEQSKIATGNLEKEIADVDNSLKTLYSVILAKENTKAPEVPLEKPVTESAPPQEVFVPKPLPPEKEYMKNVPVAAKERLAEETKIEEKQRLKFMEDVEKWAAENNNQQEK